jgi:hypothetical protein
MFGNPHPGLRVACVAKGPKLHPLEYPSPDGNMGPRKVSEKFSEINANRCLGLERNEKLDLTEINWSNHALLVLVYAIEHCLVSTHHTLRYVDHRWWPSLLLVFLASVFKPLHNFHKLCNRKNNQSIEKKKWISFGPRSNGALAGKTRTKEVQLAIAVKISFTNQVLGCTMTHGIDLSEKCGVIEREWESERNWGVKLTLIMKSWYRDAPSFSDNCSIVDKSCAARFPCWFSRRLKIAEYSRRIVVGIRLNSSATLSAAVLLLATA